jgi:hypothetical protein
MGHAIEFLPPTRRGKIRSQVGNQRALRSARSFVIASQRTQAQGQLIEVIISADDPERYRRAQF